MLMQCRYSLRMARLTTLMREAAHVREIADLTDADIARATGAAKSTSRAWLNGTRSPTGERAERLIELSALVEPSPDPPASSA